MTIVSAGTGTSTSLDADLPSYQTFCRSRSVISLSDARDLGGGATCDCPARSRYAFFLFRNFVSSSIPFMQDLHQSVSLLQ